MKDETAFRITELRNLVTLTYRIKWKYEKTGNLLKNLIWGPLAKSLLSWKTVSTVFHIECVFVALFIQHAKCMCRVVLYSVSCPALPYFPHLSHKGHDFRTKDFYAKKRALIFSTILSKALFIIRITVRDNTVPKNSKCLCGYDSKCLSVREKLPLVPVFRSTLIDVYSALPRAGFGTMCLGHSTANAASYKYHFTRYWQLLFYAPLPDERHFEPQII
jgi:hypothetical protein